MDDSDIDIVRVGDSGDHREPVAVYMPGRNLPRITRDEARALYRALGAYLAQTMPAPPIRNSGR